MRNEQMARIKAFEALIAQKQEEAQARYKQEELRGKQIANEKGQWDLTLGYAYDDTDRLLAQDVQRTNIEQGKASTALSYASIGNMESDNARADRTEARLSATAGDAKTLSELRAAAGSKAPACDQKQERQGRGAWALRGRHGLRFLGRCIRPEQGGCAVQRSQHRGRETERPRPLRTQHEARRRHHDVRAYSAATTFPIGKPRALVAPSMRCPRVRAPSRPTRTTRATRSSTTRRGRYSPPPTRRR